MITFFKLAILFVVVLLGVFPIYLEGKKKGFEEGLKKGQKRPGNQHFDDVLRPLLLAPYRNELEPSYEETDEMGVDQDGYFYFIQRGQGGGKRMILCGLTDKCCDKECFKKHALYFNNNGEPLFFCRYYYIVFKGRKYLELEYKVNPELVKELRKMFGIDSNKQEEKQ